MHRFALILAVAALAGAQSENPFHRPPAGVDEALRARVKEFFGYHVTGEFRKAEAMVAEDTKDYFYTHNKPKYLGIEISKIDYSDDFQRATVLVLCEQYVKMPGFLDKPIKIPTPSAWKLENGIWVWWVDPASLGRSPFGQMHEGPKPGQSPGAPGAAPITRETAPTSVDFLFKQVKLDRNQVTLKPGESATINISNNAPGAMTVSSRSKLTGIEYSFDKPTLQQGEKATMTIKAVAGAKSATLDLEVNPIAQILPVQITIQAPPPQK